VTESEWLVSTQPVKMMEHLRGHATDRKLRLFSVACCRSEWAVFDPLHHQILERWEGYADEILGEVGIALDLPITIKTQPSLITGECYDSTIAVVSSQDSWRGANAAARLMGQFHVNPGNPDTWGGRNKQGAALAREIFGNPFQNLDAEVKDQSAIKLAREAYSKRTLPSGHLDKYLIRRLAGTLATDSAGLEPIFIHLRSPGPHVRGCWALDLVLRKS
jgi:hypothetical protein